MPCVIAFLAQLLGIDVLGVPWQASCALFFVEWDSDFGERVEGVLRADRGRVAVIGIEF